MDKHSPHHVMVKGLSPDANSCTGKETGSVAHTKNVLPSQFMIVMTVASTIKLQL